MSKWVAGPYSREGRLVYKLQETIDGSGDRDASSLFSALVMKYYATDKPLEATAALF